MQQLSRKHFIVQTSIAVAGILVFPVTSRGDDLQEMIMTVQGPINTADMKFALTHEHILVDFIGAAKASKSRYNAAEVFETALPFLQNIKALGCQSFFDCTPAYLGRNVELLKRLSTVTGLHIVTNTGYYGAAGEKYLPEFVYTESAAAIAARWIKEWKNGIDDTSIRPGFIKTGMDAGPLTTAQVKLMTAAAITHLETGLTIAVHTGDGKAAKAQLEILKQQGVAARARIWVHAQNEKDTTYHIEAAKQGSWISFDGISATTTTTYLQYLHTMKKAQLLDHVLLSQDSGWYHVGEEKGGVFNSYSYVINDFIPALLKDGFTPAEIDRLFIKNPAKAFAIKVRRFKQ